MEDYINRVLYKWDAQTKVPLLVASPGCFTGDMLVMTPTGPTEIRKLKSGDTVYDGDGNHTTLANACRIDNDPKPMIYWRTNAGQKKGATYDHPFYDKRTRRFYPLYQFIWRDMGTRQREELELLCKRYGKAFDPYELRGIQAEDYATSDGRKWLPPHTDGWTHREDTQTSSRDVHPESTQQSLCEPQELHTHGQQSRELRVDDSKREPRLQLSRWEYTKTTTGKSNTSKDESQVYIGDKRLCELLERRIHKADGDGRSMRNKQEQTHTRHTTLSPRGESETVCEKTGKAHATDTSTLSDTRYQNEQESYTKELCICESTLRDITVCESEPYYSIEIQGRNKTYIIEDGWIVHNCGKTAFVEYLAQKLNTTAHIINLASFEEVDMNGMPYIDPDTHEVRLTVPAFAKDLKPGDIIFFDETNLASPPVRNVLQTLVLSRRFPNGEPLPENTRIIGAMNVADDLDSITEFSNAMKDRWAPILFSLPADEWYTLYLDNFGKPQTPEEQEIRKDLVSFLKLNPQMVEHRPPIDPSSLGITDPYEQTTVTYATPNRRNWDNLARELAQVPTSHISRYRKNIFIENVGLEAWRTYKEYLSTQTKPLSTYKWDGEPDEITQQINRLKATKNVDKQAEYFVRAHKYCKNKEVVSAVLPDVISHAISTYGVGYKDKLPEFYKVYREMGM